ncbi:UNVERIFIED_CONTAM: putative calcium-binding protein CML44 [Sesamum calycinum]|uniref:Calcium-binding protein CML44 n=1 Tax=Sesamum calycinum TaxID=2727403 RepID=A0AAW2QP91_9LAMI
MNDLVGESNSLQEDDKTRGEFYINHEVVVGSSFPNKTRTVSYLSDEESRVFEQETCEIEQEDDILERDLQKAFRVFDLDGDGFITSEELQIALSRLGLWDEHSGQDCRRMIDVYDTNSDGLLDFEEFKDMMLVKGQILNIRSHVEDTPVV